MSDLKNLPDWNNWILEKKANAEAEELEKAHYEASLNKAEAKHTKESLALDKDLHPHYHGDDSDYPYDSHDALRSVIPHPTLPNHSVITRSTVTDSAPTIHPKHGKIVASSRGGATPHAGHFKAFNFSPYVSAYLVDHSQAEKEPAKADMKKSAREEMIEYLEKAVREDDWSSRHTDPSINPSLGGKYGKIHGGDPRKKKDTDDMAVEIINGKPRKRVSGASSLRSKYNTRQEDGQEQSD